MFSEVIIHKLQDVRRKTFAEYDSIVLDADAVGVLARFFVNPDCQSDIDLFAIHEPETKLSFLGGHIITAAPSTLAKYAEKHKLTTLTEKDILLCFALDHAHDVHDTHVADAKNPLYALAHIALPSEVIRLKKYKQAELAELRYDTLWGSVIFKNVVVPKNISVNVGDSVFQHFGVISAHAQDKRFIQKLIKLQQTDDFIAQLGRDAARKKIVIDFANTSLFHKDVLGLMLKPRTAKTITDPGDLKRGKVIFKN